MIKKKPNSKNEKRDKNEGNRKKIVKNSLKFHLLNLT
jgi:hypothetical protein